MTNRSDHTAWVEGMLVTPQHFQQFARATHYHRVTAMHYLHPYAYGFKSLTLNQTALVHGKIQVSQAEGLFSDGSLFKISEQDALTIDSDAASRDVTVYLGIPVNDHLSEHNAKNARYHLAEIRLTDQVATPQAQQRPILVQQLNVRLLTEHDALDDYYTLPIAKVKTVSEEKGIVLDTTFIAPCLDIAASPILQDYLTHLLAFMARKQTQLSASLVNPIQSQTVASVTDILLLQLLNRYHALLTHYQALPVLHPYLFFQTITTLLAEMRTFLHNDRKLDKVPLYQHQALAETMAAVIQPLFDWLNAQFHHQAFKLALSTSREGLFQSETIEPQQLDHADFIVVFTADMPGERLQAQLGTHVKVAAPDTIEDLLNLQLSGLPLVPLSVVPPQLPYQAEAAYFRINPTDNNDALWAAVKTHQSLAIAVSQLYPNLNVTLWAIPTTGETS